MIDCNLLVTLEMIDCNLLVLEAIVGNLTRTEAPLEAAVAVDDVNALLLARDVAAVWLHADRVVDERVEEDLNRAGEVFDVAIEEAHGKVRVLVAAVGRRPAAKESHGARVNEVKSD